MAWSEIGAKKRPPSRQEGGLLIKESDLGELGKLCLDRLKIWKIAGALVDLGVLNNSGLIDEEGRPLGNSAHDEIFLGQELRVCDPVGFGGLVIVIGKELEGDSLFLGPSGLGKRVVP